MSNLMSSAGDFTSAAAGLHVLCVSRQPKQNVSERAKWARLVRGDLTQEDFAEKLQVHRTTVSDWERDANEPEPPTLRQIFEKFPDAPPYPGGFPGLGNRPNGSQTEVVSGVDRTAGSRVETGAGGSPEGYSVKTDEGRIIAKRLDAIEDDTERASAFDRCIEALKSRPPQLGANKTPGRARSR
jgi:transcriptional regulator with XRE-family HTH domain